MCTIFKVGTEYRPKFPDFRGKKFTVYEVDYLEESVILKLDMRSSAVLVLFTLTLQLIVSQQVNYNIFNTKGILYFHTQCYEFYQFFAVADLI